MKAYAFELTLAALGFTVGVAIGSTSACGAAVNGLCQPGCLFVGDPSLDDGGPTLTVRPEACCLPQQFEPGPGLVDRCYPQVADGGC